MEIAKIVRKRFNYQYKQFYQILLGFMRVANS